MITAIEAIHRGQLNDLGGGNYTVTYPRNHGIPDGPKPMSSDYGVLSCNPPSGTFWLMPAGTAGSYEKCRINSGSLAFAPPYNGPLTAYIIPFVSDPPNV